MAPSLLRVWRFPTAVATPTCCAWSGQVVGRCVLMLLLVVPMLLPAHGRAQTRPLPQPGEQDIQLEWVQPASPSQWSTVNPAQDAAVQKLRNTANTAVPAVPANRRGKEPANTSARDAAWLLGLLYLHGLGVVANPAEAQQWFQRAQDLGHPLASAGLAWCAIDGCGSVPRPAAARPWVAQLRPALPGRAYFLEWLLEDRLTPLQTAQPTRQGKTTPPLPHHDLLLRSARANDVNALIELGFEYVAQERIAEADKMFRAAAPRSAAAAANVEILSNRNQGTASTQPQDRSANDWYLSARRFHRGDGVPANYTEAIRQYQIAAAAGSAPARRMLQLIYSRPAPDGNVDVMWMQQLANMDVSAQNAVVLQLPVTPALLQREPTPLYDLVPASWRTR